MIHFNSHKFIITLFTFNHHCNVRTLDVKRMSGFFSVPGILSFYRKMGRKYIFCTRKLSFNIKSENSNAELLMSYLAN